MSTSRARSRSPPPRTTTPLRASSRTSFRASTNLPLTVSPLDSLEPQFAEFSDSLSDLETNLMHLQLMHESLSRFSENFAAFLYGLEMNAFVVDWPEQPLLESLQRWKSKQKNEETILKTPTKSVSQDVDSTLLSDTTFASMKATPARRRTVAPSEKNVIRGRGSGIARGNKSTIPPRSVSSASNTTRGRGTGTRGSALPTRGRGRGVK